MTPAGLLQLEKSGLLRARLWHLRARQALVYRAVQFQATGRSKTRPLRRSTADAVDPPKAKPPKLLQPIWPLNCRWLEPAAHGG